MDISSGYSDLDTASEILYKDPNKALKMCDEFASQNPENYMLHLTRIMAHNRLGNWEGMMCSANDYVRFRPDHPQPFWERAEAAYRLGMYQQSISDTKKAMALDEDGFLDSMPYRLLAMNHGISWGVHKKRSQYAVKAS